ncbi:uncharacterized protein [Epargyreus clarus]|uniref:uncharacterized protein n=1 Tax=Epargyreus clarus TaxID=520877 RepID=UPI003C2F0F33
MTTKLNEAENIKLVQLYREHECLWDNKSIHYRNKDMRATALQSIAQELSIEGIGPSEVKNKIKSLRATYNLELEKIKKSSRSGAGGNVYIPKVRWFEEMDAFIRNVSIQRKTTMNLNPDEVERNIYEMFGEEDASNYRQARRRVESCSSVLDTDLSISDESEGTSISELEESDVIDVSDEGGMGDDLEWIDEPTVPPTVPLSGQPGIKIFNFENLNPVEYFKILFNISFLNNLAMTTNDHAEEVISRGISANSRLNRWKPTNGEELLIFLGILFFMGTVRLNK